MKKLNKFKVGKPVERKVLSGRLLEGQLTIEKLISKLNNKYIRR